MKISRYTKLGILIVTCIAILVWGINYLKGIDIFKRTTTYYATYDRVDGLVKSSVILVNGFQVGLVQHVGFSDKNDGSFIVELAIEGDLKIPKTSKAVIASSDLLGTKAIKLELHPSDSFYEDNDTITSHIETDMFDNIGKQIAPVTEKAESLLAALDSIMSSVNSVLNSDSQKHISKAIAHTSETMANLEQLSNELSLIIKNKDISNIISNTNKLSENLSENSEKFTKIIDNFSSISDSLSNAQIASLVNNLENITKDINNGNGSIGKMIHDDELYKNLNNLSSSIDNLLADFYANPQKYIKLTAVDFGKNIYITDADIKADDKISFCIKLLESNTQIPLNNPMFASVTNIEESLYKGKYMYLSNSTNDLSSLYSEFSRISADFPNAEIIASSGNKQIKLSKAIKKVSK